MLLLLWIALGSQVSSPKSVLSERHRRTKWADPLPPDSCDPVRLSCRLIRRYGLRKTCGACKTILAVGARDCPPVPITIGLALDCSPPLRAAV